MGTAWTSEELALVTAELPTDENGMITVDYTSPDFDWTPYAAAAGVPMPDPLPEVEIPPPPPEPQPPEPQPQPPTPPPPPEARELPQALPHPPAVDALELDGISRAAPPPVTTVH